MNRKTVVIYAGFHKTGTTSAQKALAENAGLLRPDVDVFLRNDMAGLCDAARDYSQMLDEPTLNRVRLEANKLFATLDNCDSKKAVLASEDLSGHMPGRRGVTTFATAAPVLMRTLAEQFENCDLSFLFSTRSPDRWLASCHAQHVQYTRITDGVEAYADAYANSAKLDDVIGDIRTAVQCPVISTTLDVTSRTDHGPLTPVLDMLEIPEDTRQRLTRPKHHNASPSPQVLNEMLALNRSDLSLADVRAAKKEIRRTIRRQRKQGSA